MSTTVQRDLSTRLKYALAQDTFTRANQSGLGTASDGETWATPSGSATYSIASNEGKVTAVTALTWTQLGTKTIADAEALVRVSVSSTNYTAAGVFLRGNGSNTGYRCRINSNTVAQGFGIVYTNAGTTTNLALTSFTVSLSTFYWIRFRIIGSNMAAKVWQDGGAEPTTWTVTASDTNLASAGNFGLITNTTTSTDAAQYDNFVVVASQPTIAPKDITSRFKLSATANRDISARFRLTLASVHDLTSRFKLGATQIRDLSTRFALSSQRNRDVSARLHLAPASTHDLSTRFCLTISRASLVDVDVIGNGFIVGLPGIYGNVWLQALQGTAVSIYTPDGHTLLGTLTLADFYFLSLTPQGVLWLADQAINIDQISGTPLSSTQIPVTLVIGGVAASNTNPLAAQDIEQTGYVAASSPPSATNAGSDTSYTFTSQVSRVILQNNTPANVNIAFDAVASAGSLLVVPGATLVYPKKCTVLHLFTAAAQNINGTSAGNIVVLGAL